MSKPDADDVTESESMGAIRVLSPHLVNKIAAGECIERPASVVKELLENALDAGAGRIDVVVEDGGKKLIRVVDNGSGIAADDLPLAVQAHATSKLTSEAQLYAIQSLGFRGEALASIAAVSHLKIISTVPQASEGAQIEVDGGLVGPVRAAASATGTIVEVRNLFFNTPARRKFLRSAGTELGHIEEQLARIALHRPGVGFSLKHGRRMLRHLPPVDNKLQRIEDLFGPELASTLIPILSQEADGTVIEAYICRPQFAKPSNHWQYYFVNDRWVRDRFINHAVNEAYRGLIDQQRQCVAFVFLHIDPTRVDVNVHPTKGEVRFADSGQVHSQILGALREKLLGSDLTVAFPTATAEPAPARRTGPAAEEAAETTEPKQPQALARSDKDGPDAERLKQAITDFLNRAQPAGQARLQFDRPIPRQAPKRRDFVPQTSVQPAVQQPQGLEGEAPPQAAISADKRLGALQVHNTYLVAETQDGIVIIDQHALHERVIYEQLRRRLQAGAVEQQKLLVPQVVQVTPGQLALLLQIADKLQAVGLDLQQFGPQAVAVHGFPALLERLDVAAFVEDLLTRLDETGIDNSEQLLEGILQSMACKAAVKAGDPLAADEIQALVQQSSQVDYSSNCPHGRPAALRMTLAELQKRFRRT